MALTLEQALGRQIEDLEDAVLAQRAFGYVKHAGESSEGARERAEEDINAASNSEFLSMLSIGIGELKWRGLL